MTGAEADAAAVAAWRGIIEAQKTAARVMREGYPLGSRVYWREGKNPRMGRVVRHTFDAALFAVQIDGDSPTRVTLAQIAAHAEGTR